MAYPKWLYHRDRAPEGVLVACEADDLYGDGWVSTPAAFDPNYVEPPPLPPDVYSDLIARGGRPYVAYPAWRYHVNGEAKVVDTAEADEQLDKAVWKDSPVFPTTPVAPITLPPPPPVRVVVVDRKSKDKE